ncbi:MAG: hypothetical protein MHMPM18_002910 [Marteilia pararefringens]
MAMNGVEPTDPIQSKLICLMAEFFLSEVITESAFIAQKRSRKSNVSLKMEDIEIAMKTMGIPFPPNFTSIS